jgi:uncharacterized protein (DUF58 family)
MGILPLIFYGIFPQVAYGVAAFDILVLAIAFIDYFQSRREVHQLSIERIIKQRPGIGEEITVRLQIENKSDRAFKLIIKDEYPPEFTLLTEREFRLTARPGEVMEASYKISSPRRGKFEFGKTAVRHLSRWQMIYCQYYIDNQEQVTVYPSTKRIRELQYSAIGNRIFLTTKPKMRLRGEGREFESLRDYITGDDFRHISWTATAKRSKLTTRQFQIEKDQSIIIALDAGRLMTQTINGETKFETALHCSLALASAASAAGDNVGFLVFCRYILNFIPPGRGNRHLEAIIKSMSELEPELVEPSYLRMLRFASTNVKKRSLIIIITDIVDDVSSKELITSLKLIRPRHLPLIVAIADRDLRAVVSEIPKTIPDLFLQSTAEELLAKRQLALSKIEILGGHVLDVTTASLAAKLVDAYLDIKRRGAL